MNRVLKSLVLLAPIGLSAQAGAQSLPTSATIDAEPIVLTAPERFQVVSTLEPIRKVSIVAPVDGVLRSLEAALGTTIRETQQVAEMDRGEAAARLKIAEAELRERQATADAPNASPAVKQAQVEAAEARVELARLELNRMTLRAPFAGRIVATPVSSGQYVLKGTVIAELADVTILKALAPVDRTAAKPGGQTSVSIEQEEVSARVHSIIPLPTDEEYRPLRELAAPFAAAWIQVPNPKGELEPGLRVRSASLPTSPVAVVPRVALKAPEAGSPDSTVQVIRAEHVVDVRVKVLGPVGPERVQVSGGFRASDALIVSSSVPLLTGTFVRFGASEKVEGAPPDPTQPGRAASVAPTSAPARAAPSRPAAPAAPTRTPPRRPAQGTPRAQPGATPF
jgi:multidrug efflux pump subunit AcrA (membrane-fusion protein)